MSYDGYPWIKLYWALLDADGPAYSGVLLPWLQDNPGELERLAALGARTSSAFQLPLAVTLEESWYLYAASRVNGLLLLRFQHGDADGSSWPGPQISLPEYQTFMGALGLQEVACSSFHPFFHEIVSVDQSDDEDEPISVTAVHWPTLMLGPLLFSRAGVTVRGGTRHVRKDAAEHSTLYWAHRRKNRPHQDLSHGWGHNSQWRTSFRWDLMLDGILTYNAAEPDSVDLATWSGDADTSWDGVSPDSQLTIEQRRELLINRCFITMPEPAPVGDHWPYSDYLQLPAPPASWAPPSGPG